MKPRPWPWSVTKKNSFIARREMARLISAAAMLVYSDFSKMAVFSSENRDNNVYNRRCSEKCHEIKWAADKDGNVRFECKIDNNSDIASNLKGHLLLVSGDLDNNVHPCTPLSVAKALIKANKRIYSLFFPGKRHGLGEMNSFVFWLGLIISASI